MSRRKILLSKHNKTRGYTVTGSVWKMDAFKTFGKRGKFKNIFGLKRKLCEG
jgi:hypothetical protein